MMPTENPRSILCAIDFSEQSRHALRWAAALASWFGSDLTVINVVDPLLAQAVRVRSGQDLAREDIEPALRQFVAATLTAPPPAVTLTSVVFRTPIGDAARSILETAEEDGADLIVMGTQGLSGFRKWLLGSTILRLLRRTRVPVLGVPQPDESLTHEEPSVRRILATTDFGNSSITAVKAAVQWARACPATLTVSHIVTPLTVPPEWRSLVETSDETRVANGRAQLHALAQQLCGAHECDEVVVLGHPADAIASVALERRAELIVMGLASDDGLLSARPGSIAYRVLSSTSVPVLIVPHVD